MITIRKYIPEIVYGGIDGTVTTFAIMAGVVGAGLASSVILILGFANLFADGFSMAASNYLSVQADPRSVKKPFFTALTTFSSFIVFGSIPTLPYIGLIFAPRFFENTFIISSIATTITFVFVGTVKATVVGGSKIFSATKTLLIGGTAATIAYVVGAFLQSLV